MQLTLQSAKALRDGGIDASAALNEALKDALIDLSPEAAREIKIAVGLAMAAIHEQTINPAVSAFPELEPDESTWNAVAIANARKRSRE